MNLSVPPASAASGYSIATHFARSCGVLTAAPESAPREGAAISRGAPSQEAHQEDGQEGRRLGRANVIATDDAECLAIKCLCGSFINTRGLRQGSGADPDFLVSSFLHRGCVAHATSRNMWLRQNRHHCSSTANACASPGGRHTSRMTAHSRTGPPEVRSDGLSSEMLQPRSLVELVTARLRGEILSGALEPGERLVEEQLTQLFQISRAPLREALRLLAEQGLVERGCPEFRGTSVAAR